MGIISISGKKNSGKDLVGKIIQYLTANKNLPHSLKFPDYEDFQLEPTHAEFYSVYKTKKWADKLKDIVCLLLGCTREQLEEEVFKETPLGEEWWKYKIHDGSVFRWATLEEYNREGKYQKFIVKLTPRLLLQLLGTECGREIIHPNIWVNSLMNEYTSWTPKVHSGSMMDANCYSNGPCRFCKKPFYGYKRQFMCKDCVKPIFPNWIITDTRFPNELKATEGKGFTIRVNRFCHDSLEDYLVCYPDKEVCKKATKIVAHSIDYNDMEQKLKEIPESKNFTPLNKQHESETALDSAEFDYVIENNGTIEELIEKIRVILVKREII